jgi:hypothetical protein
MIKPLSYHEKYFDKQPQHKVTFLSKPLVPAESLLYEIGQNVTCLQIVMVHGAVHEFRLVYSESQIAIWSMLLYIFKFLWRQKTS